MPFDGKGFQGGGGRRTPRRPSDNTVTILIVAVATALLVLPISLQAFADMLRYLRD